MSENLSAQDGAAQVTRLARQLMLSVEDVARPGAAGLLGFEAGLSLAQDYGGVFPFFWDRRQPEALASSGFRELYGIAPGALLTDATLMAALHPDDVGRVRALQQDLLGRGGNYEVEFRVPRQDGSVRWVQARGRTLSDSSGRPCGTAGVHLDVTERKLGELVLAQRDAEVAANEARLRTILNTMPQMVWSALPDGNHDFYNDRWYAYTGLPRGGGNGDAWLDLFHPDDRVAALNDWQNSLTTGEPYEAEVRLRRADGSYGWVLARALPIRDSDGRIERWFGSSTDIDDIKVAEDQLEMIARELAHRIRNIFAVVNSLLMLSSRADSPERDFADAARARIDALSRAHDYIRPYAGDPSLAAAGLTVHGLIRSLLAPYCELGQGPDAVTGQRCDVPRVVLEGDDLAIGPSAGTSLALVVHELATNAVKHGCLSTGEGVLRIGTRMDDATAHIVWEELGGPSAEGEPQRRGFGTTLSERALKIPLSGELQREWLESGLVARIRVPVERLAR